MNNQYTVVQIVISEGHTWETIVPTVVTKDELLVAMTKRYRAPHIHEPARYGFVTRISGIQTRVHAIKVLTGEEWDVNNGWRTGEPK